MYSRDRARRSFVDSAVLRVVSQISTAVGYVILVRALPTEPFGVYSLFNTFIAAIGAVLSLGLEQVLLRYSPEYLRAGNEPAAARLVRIVASGRFAINVLLLAVILLAWNHLAPLVNVAPYRSAFIIFCVLDSLAFPGTRPATRARIAHAAPLQRRRDARSVTSQARWLLSARLDSPRNAGDGDTRRHRRLCRCLRRSADRVPQEGAYAERSSPVSVRTRGAETNGPLRFAQQLQRRRRIAARIRRSTTSSSPHFSARCLSASIRSIRGCG